MNGYIEKINKRHRLADQVKNICFTNEEWHVSSSSIRNLVYIVKRQFDDESYVCDCKTKCLQCKTCIHEFSCNCHDYVVSNNLCKHIHAAINYRQNQGKCTPISSSEPVIAEPTNILMEVDINSLDANSTDVLPNNVSTCMLEKDDCIVTPKFEMLINKFEQLNLVLQTKRRMFDEKKVTELDKTIDKALKIALSDELNMKENNSSEPINKKNAETIQISLHQEKTYLKNFRTSTKT